MVFLGGKSRSCSAVFCENLKATRTQNRRLWIWIWMGNLISTASLPISRNQPLRKTQPGHPSVGRRNDYQRKLRRKHTPRDALAPY